MITDTLPPRSYPRSDRKSLSQIQQRKLEMLVMLLRHQGQYVLLISRVHHKLTPYYVRIIGRCGSTGMLAEQRCFSINGGVTGHIRHVIDLNSLLTGDQRVVTFDEGV